MSENSAVSSGKFLKVRIIDSYQEIYSCNDATMVLMPGEDGEIGVMYGRIPLIIELKAGDIKIFKDSKITSTISITSSGIARVNIDSVDIILVE